MAKQKLVVVVGPTASGKTAMAINIAKQFQGEVISADSRQVYRGLDIGTAKVTPEEMDGVQHHLIDIVGVNTVYTAAHFKRDAEKAIKEIAYRDHLPIVSGGTFFYIDTLLDKSPTAKVSPNQELRAELEKKTAEELFSELQEKDPRRALDIDPQNKRRLIRALEIVTELGAVPSHEPSESAYEVLKIGIQIDKADLQLRLQTRAENWLKNGFLEEVKHLVEQGISRDRLAEIGFEYMLGLEYVEGKIDRDQFIETFVQKNWQYAKRQLTWLRRDQSINWVSPADKSEVELLVANFVVNN